MTLTAFLGATAAYAIGPVRLAVPAAAPAAQGAAA